MNKLFVLPGETSKEDGGSVTLGLGKRVLNGPVKVLGRALLQACLLLQSPTLLLQALTDYLLS
jgi:hypothetical protein